MSFERFSVDDLLKLMDLLRPEPLEASTTTRVYRWRLGALRKCLVVLETNGIARFMGRDRWELNPKYPDADAIVRAARSAGIDVDEQHG